MGEEEKRPPEAGEGKTMEEKKPAEEGGEEAEKKTQEESKDSKEDSSPPPQEIVLRVHMHCEGCARKIRRCLKGFEGVEEVKTDCKTGKVVVKGEKADPLKVVERVQRKAHRHVDLLSPLPPPEEKAAAAEEKPKPEEKKAETPVVVTVVLKVHMHCEACAMEIKKRIQRMKGVESAESELKSSQVTVKGAFEPPALVEYVYKRTGKHAVVVKIDPPPPAAEPPAASGDDGTQKEEGKGDNNDDSKGEKVNPSDEEKKGDDGENGEGKASENANAGGDGDGGTEEERILEVKKIENPYYYYYYPPRLAVETHAYPPPQIFSDENPNACTVM
ncbi:PREDICTED: heavy metal-associated isoprenylated plant protein 3 [Tarenaya hassleriana]|uniref:heavy metal-associated isoprenylated plant protein 3 n=1 Tax=Tarenaya hassleriana TaxID=28532 RepID=UPI00053C9F29|nr:PREDICTED: heavy metal-associated isoprenylated plant protein 3 [Tarenaya hassleriana]